ncbi:MAG: radical SAM protein [Candidatus Auribacterota bacterium]|nr:radical SAM protein [Candidatus Auribacterota bacterium]
MSKDDLITFGPVPSRRLGHSLGINNIPPKICTYSCVYCQLGRTLNMQTKRAEFYKPSEILRAADRKVKEARSRGESVDYITFVPDGEPTLDVNLGKQIELLKLLGIKIAVISNTSLIWQKDVQDDLCKANWVSLKIDAISEDIWRRVDRPHKSLQLDKIFQGIAEFSRTFTGELATETMLIQDINDNTEEIEKIANFIAGLKDAKSYISIPTRPPAEKWVRSATEHTINTAYQIFKEKSINAEYLIGYEGNAFAFTGNVEEDLLSITSVHPMREEAVDEFLKKAKSDWSIIEKLVSENKLVELKYQNNKFYMRRL